MVFLEDSRKFSLVKSFIGQDTDLFGNILPHLTPSRLIEELAQ